MHLFWDSKKILFLGVSFQVFIDQENYMLNTLSKKAGVRLVIHDPSMPPSPNEFGIDLEPNTASSIAIQQVSCCKLAI